MGLIARILRSIKERREKKEVERLERNNLIFKNRAILERFHNRDKIKTSETRGYSPVKRSSESSYDDTPYSYATGFSDFSSSDSCSSSDSSSSYSDSSSSDSGSCSSD